MLQPRLRMEHHDRHHRHGHLSSSSLIYQRLMKYSEMIQEAKSKGLTTEAMMWDSVEDVESLLGKMKDSHPKEYWQFMRKQHGRLYHNHYTEEFADHDVKQSKWIDKDGHERNGEYWSKAQIEEATKNLAFPAGTTPCDRYVAFNMFHHDTCKVLSDEQIIKAAHEFFFCDKDAPEGKVWIYVCAMNK